MTLPHRERPGSPCAPVKVAQLVLRLDVGGLERMVLRLMARLDRRLFEPILCSLEPAGALGHELSALGIRSIELPRRPGAFDVRVVASLSRWLRLEDVRLVHTHNPAPHVYGSLAASLTRLAGGGRGPRVVHTKHGRNVPHTRKSVALSRLASVLSAHIVAVSDDAREVALGVEHTPREKVSTIHNGVDLDRFHPGADSRPARARLGVPAQGFHVGCVARLSEEKDHATLLDAFAALRRTVPDAHLTLVGDGPLRGELEERACARGVAEAVTFAGMRADVANLVGAFDVFALASRTEGISLTLLEAAAAGIPIVATRVGGNPEVVVHGDTGLLVPPAQPGPLAAALEEMASRRDRRAMGLAGRARVEARFSEDAMVQAYEALYCDVLGWPSQPGWTASLPTEPGQRAAPRASHDPQPI